MVRLETIAVTEAQFKHLRVAAVRSAWQASAPLTSYFQVVTGTVAVEGEGGTGQRLVRVHAAIRKRVINHESRGRVPLVEAKLRRAHPRGVACYSDGLVPVQAKSKRKLKSKLKSKLKFPHYCPTFKQFKTAAIRTLPTHSPQTEAAMPKHPPLQRSTTIRPTMQLQTPYDPTQDPARTRRGGAMTKGLRLQAEREIESAKRRHMEAMVHWKSMKPMEVDYDLYYEHVLKLLV
jgi:hypothetical protein